MMISQRYDEMVFYVNMMQLYLNDIVKLLNNVGYL